MSDSVLIRSPEIHTKTPKGTVDVDCPFGDAPLEKLLAAGPWRTFRWHRGQKHYSGSFWSATESALVIYESRLELAWLLDADFDRSVSRIVAQPFLMTAQVDGVVRRHVPDFLLLTGSGPVVVDVKPTRRLARPEVASAFAWSRQVVEAHGWRFEVRSEPDPVRLENIRFLAGYRRSWLFAPEIVERLDTAVRAESTLAEAFTAAPEFEPSRVRATVFHLLWSGRLVTDLGVRLGPGSVLRRPV